MLSHFMGGCNRHNVKELWLAQRRLERLTDTLARAQRQSQDTIAARDRRIGELERELGQAHHARARAQAGQAPGGPGRGM
jgi:prefoldin subunit 5